MAAFSSICDTQVFAKQLTLLEEHAQLLRGFAEHLVNAGSLPSDHTEVLAKLYLQAVAAVEGGKTCQNIFTKALNVSQPRSNAAPPVAQMPAEREKRKHPSEPQISDDGSPVKKVRVEAVVPSSKLRNAKSLKWMSVNTGSMGDRAARQEKQHRDGDITSPVTEYFATIPEPELRATSFSDVEHEDIHAEVAARLSRNEQRRKEMSGETVPVAVKRKRHSGEFVVSIIDNRQSVAELNAQTKRHKASY